MKNRATFLMPVYQGQKDFDDTMRSLTASTVPCGVIVVDDGSSPPLRVGEYAPHLDVALIRLPDNQGIVAAMNAGLRAAIDAGYEFIARIDAGDYVHPDRLARQIGYLDNHPKCMLVGSDAEIRDETGAYWFDIEPPRDPATLSRALHERAWLLHPSVMYRAAVIREVGFYTDRFEAAEDYEMFLRIAARHEVGVVPESLIVYVVRRTGISRTRVRLQALSRLRIQLRYFRWHDWLSYYGVLRTIGTLLLSQNLKSSLKARLLYTRHDGKHSQADSGSPLKKAAIWSDNS
jgi:glycosyltransferase involved in cell wall biosynthesis